MGRQMNTETKIKKEYPKKDLHWKTDDISARRQTENGY